jgi:c-di-GMP-binding flagellar brake protein YcgR
MAEPLSLLPMRPADLALGVPLGQTVYDWHGNVMLAAGSVIDSQEQLDEILANGYLPDASWAPVDQPELAISATPAAAAVRQAARGADAGQPAQREAIVRMDEVHWTVGEAMTLQPLDKPSVRYAIQLIGFIKNRMLFVSAPAVEGKFELIRDGQTFVVRAFSGKKAYAFTAAALKSVHSPHPYLLLSYPREVRCTLVRQSARVAVKLIASIALGQPERVAAATITDLSTGGASLVSREPLGSKGETGRIKFKVFAAEADAYLNLQFVLRSVAREENGEGYRQGLEFVDVPARERLVLSAFVHQGLAA